MGVYLVTNITDITSDPKPIHIGDIPNRTTVIIDPGRTVDLEKISTRNQILESLQLRVHVLEGRATADTLGTTPTVRLHVDLGEFDVSGAQFVMDSEYKEDSLHVTGDDGIFVLAVRNDTNTSLVDTIGDYSPFQVDGYGRLKTRVGFESQLLAADGSLKVTVQGLTVNMGDLEINVEAEYAEDSAHVSGNVGSFVLSVRNDSETSLSDNGDYTPFQSDSIGRLKVRSGFEDSLLGTDGYLQVQAQQEGSWTTSITDGYGEQITSQVSNSRRGLDTWALKGTPEHFNGTIGLTPSTLTPMGTTTSILVTNPSSNTASSIVQVSFDGGSTFYDITRGTSLSLEAEVDSFVIQANKASVDYQIIVVYR